MAINMLANWTGRKVYTNYSGEVFEWTVTECEWENGKPIIYCIRRDPLSRDRLVSSCFMLEDLFTTQSAARADLENRRGKND